MATSLNLWELITAAARGSKRHPVDPNEKAEEITKVWSKIGMSHTEITLHVDPDTNSCEIVVHDTEGNDLCGMKLMGSRMAKAWKINRMGDIEERREVRIP